MLGAIGSSGGELCASVRAELRTIESGGKAIGRMHDDNTRPGRAGDGIRHCKGFLPICMSIPN